MTLEQWTLLFLVAVFVAAEIRRIRMGTRGSIVGPADTAHPALSFVLTSVIVRLEDGREVTARMDCCTACLGKLAVGDEIRVIPSSKGWSVGLPWLTKCRSFSRHSASLRRKAARCDARPNLLSTRSSPHERAEETT